MTYNIDDYDEFTNTFVVANRIPALIRRLPNVDWTVDMSTVKAGIDGSVFVLIFLSIIVICCLRILAANVHADERHTRGWTPYPLLATLQVPVPLLSPCEVVAKWICPATACIWMHISQMIPNWTEGRPLLCAEDSEKGDLRLPAEITYVFWVCNPIDIMFDLHAFAPVESRVRLVDVYASQSAF